MKAAQWRREDILFTWGEPAGSSHYLKFISKVLNTAKDLEPFKEIYLRPTLGGNFLAMYPVREVPLSFIIQITFYIRWCSKKISGTKSFKTSPDPSFPYFWPSKKKSHEYDLSVYLKTTDLAIVLFWKKLL